MSHVFKLNGHYDFNDILVHLPMVKEDAPVWKKICPFCGELGVVHELGDYYICHWCHANWAEHDTDTERQIQILHLNGAKMPKFGEGDMPLVERKLYGDFEYVAKIDLQEGTINFTEEGFDKYVKYASSF